MKTLKKFIERYNKNNTDGIELYLDELESYNGYYHICVTRKDFNLSSWYTFETIKNFTEWIRYMIFD